MLKKSYGCDISAMNTFRMKVTCRCLVEYDSVSDLIDLEIEDLPKPVLPIGGGSNLLFTGDFPGTLLHSKISFIESLGKGLYSVGAGVNFDSFCAWAASKGLWGAENLSLIPGDVGAAAVQNIGAYGVEVKDIVSEVYCFDLEECEMVRFGVADCGYAYRDSVFKREGMKGRYIVTHVVFHLDADGPSLSYGHLKEAVLEASGGVGPTPELVRRVIVGIREEKLPDPAKTGSAGSFFKNPVVERKVYDAVASSSQSPVPHYDLPDGSVKIPAAWLIEQCGWKGRRSGNAAVWERQPLVIVNHTGMALPEEIISLEKKIMISVRERFGIELNPEVEHV
ncbi:MAG: UDP-N-acetylmuramate dehydrogenase [Bacteroidales bacterium]|nr:UDP-N-acetylmuramate dehydrogenase [Bacteroidales bacterium]